MIHRFCLILLCLVLALPSVCFAEESEPPLRYDRKTASYKAIQMMAQALSLVQFAAKGDTDEKVLLYSALDGMARALDRYSYFVPPEMVGIFMNRMKDKRIAVGVQIARTDDGNIEIVATVPDGPAFKAGIKPKDVITAIDGQQVKNMKFISALKLLVDVNHSAGTVVNLSVMRKDVPGLLEFTVTRELLQFEKVESRPFGQYGYVRITSFNGSTVAECKEAIEELEKQNPGLKGLIIDLRNNPGGTVQAAVGLTRLFLDSGVIASFESNFPQQNVKFKAEKGETYKGPVVILVDEGSASASELFSGALRANGRAILVGRKTHGKNSCQTFVPVSDDAGFLLTIGHFLLPDGSTIGGSGITPDVLVSTDVKDEGLLKRAVQAMEQ